MLSSGEYDDDQWYFAVGVRDAASNTLSIFVDGNLVAGPSSVPAVNVVGDTDNRLLIGAGGWGGDGILPAGVDRSPSRHPAHASRMLAPRGRLARVLGPSGDGIVHVIDSATGTNDGSPCTAAGTTLTVTLVLGYLIRWKRR